MSFPGMPDLGSILGGGSGGFQLPGFPSGFPGMGGGAQQQQQGTLGGTMEMIPYSPTASPDATDGGLGGTMNLQALLDMMQQRNQGQGGGQSYIGGQGLI